MKTSVIKPGLLVSLKTYIRGGINYRRVDIEAEHRTETGAKRARWETEKEIPDAEEYERAEMARSAARSAVVAVCCNSGFGLLCPGDREEQLAAAIEAARATAAQFNAGASRSVVEVYVLVGRVAQDDAEAARAIGAEVRALLEQMRAGIAAADPETIREAANRARAVEGMLSTEVAGKVGEAVNEARRAARELVKRVQKSGEAAAQVVAEISVARIEAARFAFLDLEAGESQAAPISAPALDLPPVAEPGSTTAAQVALPFALEV